MDIASDTTERRTWLSPLWALALVAILLPGCRTARDNQIEILERELRVQEDYIYELEDYVIQYSEKLRSMRCAQAIRIEPETKSRNSIVKKPKSEDGPELRGRDDLPTEEMPDPDTSQPDTPADEPEETLNLDDLEPPPLNIEEPVGSIQIGITEEVATVEHEPVDDSETEQPLEIPSPVDYAEAEPLALPETEAPVQQVVLYEDLFEDQDLEPAEYQATDEEFEQADDLPSPVRIVVKQLFRDDESGGPQRLLAVIEGLDEASEPVEFTGTVSLMVMVADTERPFRLKRWDFYPQDVSAAWQESHLGKGLHMELPLEDTQLPQKPLELWVRLLDGQKQKLLTQKSFLRTQLAGLEVETGAKELQPKSTPKLASSQPKKPATKEEEPTSTGWRSSTHSTEADRQNFANSLRKASRWTAQPTGGRYPHSQPARAKSSAKKPKWTAGKVNGNPIRR